MNKQTKILLLVLLLLGSAYFMISQKPWRNAEKAADAFAVQDTAGISKIFMANKRGEKVLLERMLTNEWLVNGKVPADFQKIQLLLSTLKQMQIQMPIPASMHNTAIAILASRGIKTEIYAGDKLVKTIYVGSETPDKTGTFMLLEGEDEAYSVHIPGFVGYLTPRFFMSEIKWRNKLVFNYQPQEIKQFKINYFQDNSQSFSYQKDLFEEQHVLKNAAGNLVQADTQQVKVFLSAFHNKFVEGFYDDSTFTPTERDSLFKREPFCEIQIQLVQGKSQVLTFYEKPIGDRTKERYDAQGNELAADPEKFFVRIDGIEQIASIQEYVFRNILTTLNRLQKH
ncbi:MAG: DUF4340 domain-containing protein [Sphingobacteriales bacterium]|nr:DUF4340 domain-containing protein [Sphingobacteriales bacterium]